MGFFGRVYDQFVDAQFKAHLATSQQIIDLAKKYDYRLIQIDKPRKMLRFVKYQHAAINVYVGTMTVTTEIRHPKKGRTQLHRRGVSLELLEQLFKYPRQHTGLGYYYRKEMEKRK